MSTPQPLVRARGMTMPALGFGTWRMAWRSAREGVRHALELGYRHLDTAQMYGNERQVGKGLRDSGVPRREVFVTTKLTPNNLAPRAVQRSAEKSLGRLGTGWIDLLLIHWPNTGVPLEHTLEAMGQLVERGLVRHLGVSNFPPSWMERAQRVAPVACNQVEYHPFLSQRGLLEQARRLDYVVAAYCPLGRGLVRGDPVLARIGAAHRKTEAQVALRWLLQQERVCALPKAASDGHRASNFDIFDFELSPEQMAAIDGLDRGHRIVNPFFAQPWER